MTGPRERVKSSQRTMMMANDESPPRRLLQRSYSATTSSRLPNQNAPSQHSLREDYRRNYYLQFQPDGPKCHHLAISSNALSFEEGSSATAATNLSSAGGIYGSDRTSFRFDHSFQHKPESLLPPRPPRRYRSHHPSQLFYHCTTPVPSTSTNGHPDDSVPASSRAHRPTLVRSYSSGGAYSITRRKNHPGGDKSGALVRDTTTTAGDRRRSYSSRQLLRRPSLSAISPDPRSGSSMRSLVTPTGRNKTSSGRSNGRLRYTELEERPRSSSKSDPRPLFQPQRSKSIHRKFDKPKKLDQTLDDDVWVERLILNGNNGGVNKQKTCFKSLRGNVTRKEPPTGASTIVYLEDIIVDKEGNPSRARPVQTNQQQSKKKKKKKKKDERRRSGTSSSTSSSTTTTTPTPAEPPEVKDEPRIHQLSQPEVIHLSESERQGTEHKSAAGTGAGAKTETITEDRKTTGKKNSSKKGPQQFVVKRRASFFRFMKKKNSRKNQNHHAEF